MTLKPRTPPVCIALLPVTGPTTVKELVKSTVSGLRSQSVGVETIGQSSASGSNSPLAISRLRWKKSEAVKKVFG
jgi:hypothetical protein